MCGSSADLKTGDNPYCNKIYKSLAGIPFVFQQASHKLELQPGRIECYTRKWKNSTVFRGSIARSW